MPLQSWARFGIEGPLQLHYLRDGTWPMVNIVTFDPETHQRKWEDFIVSSYGDPNYVALDPEFLRWQFLDNPANTTGAYTLWLVLHEGAVVAQLGYVPFVGRTPDGKTFNGAYPINLMARPEFRASGLGVILIRRLLETTAVVVNPGANRAGSAVAKGLGMEDLGCLRRYIYVADPEAARAIALNGRLPSIVERTVRRRSDSPDDKAVITAHLPGGTPDHFKPPVSAYAAERSRAFLRWRYESHPAFAYEFVLSPDLRSVLVFHEEREATSGTLVIRIVDFLAREEHQDWLLDAALQTAHTRGTAIVDFFCSLECYGAALKRIGFFDEAEHSDGRFAALFQPLDFRDASIRVIASQPLGENISAQSWYITKADSDQDRPNDKRAILRRHHNVR
jgi:GNAT superfamily N-acetyltransferase